MRRMLRIVLLVALGLVLSACHIRMDNATNTPYPTPDIPTLRFVFPENRSTVVEGTDLNIQLVAEDPGAGVARIELSIDDLAADQAKPEVSSAVPVFNAILHWLATGVGKHSLTATAYRADGTSGVPVTIIIEVVARS